VPQQVRVLPASLLGVGLRAIDFVEVAHLDPARQILAKIPRNEARWSSENPTYSSM